MQVNIQMKVQDHKCIHMYICFIIIDHYNSDKFHDHFGVYKFHKIRFDQQL